MIAPTITKPPSDTTADMYGEVELPCVATGNPQPIIHWFKDGKRIFMSDADPPMLLIEEMGLDDRGWYHCEAINTIGIDISVRSVLNLKSKTLISWQYSCLCTILMTYPSIRYPAI